MALSGTDFESKVKPFFKKLFEDMGFFVFEVRNQKSGTQNGFDIKIECEDDCGISRNVFIECKYYDSKLNWSELLNKQVELSGSNYSCDCFIALSPKENLSNINDNLQSVFENFSKHPVEFWTPDNDVQEMFAIDDGLYQAIYDEPCPFTIIVQEQLQKIKRKLQLLFKKKDALKFVNIIRIATTNDTPLEQYDIFNITSSSDNVRIILSYYLSLLQVSFAKTTDNNIKFPSLLIFDEPKQQNLDNEAMLALVGLIEALPKIPFQIIMTTYSHVETDKNMFKKYIRHEMTNTTDYLLKRK